MSEPPKNRTTARCAYGSAELEVVGAPITSAVCCCESCQEGSRQIEALPDGHPVCDPDGGTAMVLYRKDRVEHSKGSRLLRGYKIREGSSTNRGVATCCNSAMYLHFEKGTGSRYTERHCEETYRPWRFVCTRRPVPRAAIFRTTYPAPRRTPSSS